MDHQARAIQVSPRESLILHLQLGSTFQVGTLLFSWVSQILSTNVFAYVSMRVTLKMFTNGP